jgi:lysylphosphatidylglycerol synthetase-like protein (DUF2156 family)
MRLLGGGSGLLSLGAIVNLSKIGVATLSVLVVGLVLALFAVAIAASVRVPRNTLLPPSIAWALEYVGAYNDQSRNRFLAQWHLACEGMRLSIRAKAWGVKVATWLGVASVAAVALSFLVAIATINPSSQQDEGHTTMHKDHPSNPPAPATAAPNTSSVAPDPSGVSQTPNPRDSQAPAPQAAAEPQVVQKSYDPATVSGPQTIQFSREGEVSKNHPDAGRSGD